VIQTTEKGRGLDDDPVNIKWEGMIGEGKDE